MVQTTLTREPTAVTIGNIRLHGTYHKVQDQPNVNASGRIGILFLNSGVAPRTAGGDVAVEWADSFSKCGYPSFRFDLPGLGDSEGELPLKLLEFVRMVDSGCFTPFIRGIAKHLSQAFRLSGIVLVGNCTGAVCAIFAAAECRYIKGVVALEPYFFQRDVVRKNLRIEIGVWAARNRVGGRLKYIYSRLKRVRLLRNNTLPTNANLSLIRCWKQLVSAAMPMLVLNARGAESPVGEFNYYRYFDTVSTRRSSVAVKFIEGVHHSFADRLGRAAVRRQTEEWLRTSFPLVENDRSPLAGELTATARR